MVENRNVIKLSIYIYELVFIFKSHLPTPISWEREKRREGLEREEARVWISLIFLHIIEGKMHGFIISSSSHTIYMNLELVFLVYVEICIVCVF